jgi:hypothetical protein
MTTSEIVPRLRAAVLDTPGVASLVPTMASALSRLRLHRGARPNERHVHDGRSPAGAAEPGTAGDGITVALDHGSVTAVLDITVTSTTSVLQTALAVRSATAAVLGAAHPGPYTIRVNVLGLDPGAPGPGDDSLTPGRSELVRHGIR